MMKRTIAAQEDSFIADYRRADAVLGSSRCIPSHEATAANTLISRYEYACQPQQAHAFKRVSRHRH